MQTVVADKHDYENFANEKIDNIMCILEASNIDGVMKEERGH